MPTDAFLEKVGLDSSLASDLASMNDEGSSFEEIANHVEKVL